ncbi:GAP family protein [Nonomuraea lactucae]|uniref:GAP family protein n=1 Tax=Nonomuraea lactucae TaxID=2249762 RepID=UPI000DE3AFC5|nr:GAP family protein [Nonomuraea lactucae]
MELQVLPLAITMMVGPQIVSAIILVTTERAVRVSLAFLAGVGVATTVGVAITRTIFGLLGAQVSLRSHADSGTVGQIIQLGLVALLILAALKNYVRRETIEPPAWLTALMGATPWKAFTTGTLVILLMPSDIIVMLTVGAKLEQAEEGLIAAVPFILTTLLIAALPLLALLVFHRRAVRAMPKVREWANTHGWVINIATCLVFVALILS